MQTRQHSAEVRQSVR